MIVDNKTLYVMGVLVIITGLGGIITGVIAGTPGSIFIGTGLVITATWMLAKMNTANKKN